MAQRAEVVLMVSGNCLSGGLGVGRVLRRWRFGGGLCWRLRLGGRARR